MPDQVNSEVSLDQFSEAETDEEFGLPEFKEHFADTLKPAVLSDWTAKDFSSIYVRFRPHLERHAKRFLVNPCQVEEVVQDAFLYLMTTLPELDSELGVLKFLKWKVRLLAFDVLRAEKRIISTSLDLEAELKAGELTPSAAIEQADDAAVVALALAKLRPRQREALLATLYAEKPPSVVAGEMGISENAFRQLLFRARRAFRVALVGEADLSGMSINEILSLATRKAANSRLGASAGSLVLALMLILPSAVSPSPLDQHEYSSAAPISSDPVNRQPSRVSLRPLDETPVPLLGKTEIHAGFEQNRDSVSSEQEPSAGASALNASFEGESDSLELIPKEVVAQESEKDTLREQILEGVLFATGSGESEAPGNLQVHEQRMVLATSQTDDSRIGVSIGFAQIGDVIEVDFLTLNLYLDDGPIVAVPRSLQTAVEPGTNGLVRVHVVFTDLIAGDAVGNYGFGVAESDKLSVRKGTIIFQLQEQSLVGPIQTKLINPSDEGEALPS